MSESPALDLVAQRVPDAPTPDEVVHISEPPGRWAGVGFGDIWRYRELLFFLTWRDVKVRYKQTALGVIWAVLQPVLAMVVFTLFFGRMAGLASKITVPYPIYVYCGLLLWNFFSNAISNGSNSLVGSANLISKVYFPRIVVPFAAVGAGLIDFGVALVVMAPLLVYYHIAMTWQLVLLPVALGGAVLCAAGVGAFLASLTVEYRDFRYVVPFLVQIWMFVSGVMYPSSIVPAKWQWAYYLNPLAGFIDAMRSSLLGQPINGQALGMALLISLFLFAGGAAYFRSVESRFADVV